MPHLFEVRRVVVILVLAAPLQASAASAQILMQRELPCAGTWWISLPAQSDLATAEMLCAAIPDSLVVTQRFPEGPGTFAFDCASGICTSPAGAPEPGCLGSACFCVDDGEGYEVTTGAPTSFAVNGNDLCVDITLPAGGRDYLVSVPIVQPSLITANDLALHVGLPSSGVIRGMVTSRNGCTGTFATCNAGTAACQNLPLIEGDGYLIRYTAVLGDATTYSNPTECELEPPPPADACPLDGLGFVDGDTLEWIEPADCPLALLYDVWRGDLGCLARGCAPPAVDPCPACVSLEDDDVDTTAGDVMEPPEGGGYWYVTRVEGGTWNSVGPRQCFDRDVWLSFGCP